MQRAPDLLARWPLRRLLTAAFAFLCAALLLVGGVAQHLDAEWQLRNSAETGLRAAAIAGVERVWPRAVIRTEQRGQGPPQLVVPADWTARAEDLARAIGSYTVLARVYTPDGRLLATAGGPRDVVPAPDAARIVALTARFRAERTPDRRGKGFFDSTGLDAWAMLAVVMQGADEPVAGIIVVGTPWRPYASVLSAMARDLLLVGLALFALGALVSGLLVRLLSQPLEQLAATAQRLGEGRLDERTGLPAGRNEIHAVGRELDAMAERLQALVGAQQRFVEDASHELRTPLTVLGGTVDMLELGPSEEVRERALQTITREVARMRRLVDDLLLLARSDKRAPTYERVEVAPLIDDAREYAGMLASGRTVDATCEDGLAVDGDREQLERALRNLVDNAVRHTAEGGRIRIAAAREAARVRLEVADDGTGIPPEHLAHVFDRFYRVDAGRTRDRGGTGLGLAIVRSIAELHGGACGIESRLGEGTRVWLLLPAHAAAP